jgi:uncharacterized oxidoreductase
MPTLKADQLRKLGVELLVAAGAPENEAILVSDMLVKANLAGHDSHGIIRVLRYVDGIFNKRVRPRAEVEVVRETACSALLNGNWGLGQVVAVKAMSLAIEKAEKSTIGAVAVFNCNHVGRLADYTLMAAERNMIGLAFVNAAKIVAPYGGMERMLGTNPISLAAPASDERPFVFDMATSVCAEGKVWVKLHSKQPLPEGWIIDKHGRPSTDPADLYAGGAILPLGNSSGYKGYGLGLVCEILCGALTGAGCSYSEEFKGGNGVFFEAINIQQFTPLEEFKRKIDELIRAMRGSKRAPGFSEILVPGDPEYRMEENRRREGIPIPDATWEEFSKLATKLGVDIKKAITKTYL